MHVRNLAGKKVCILGFGREGQAMLKAIEKYAPDAVVTIADKNQELGIRNYEIQSGKNYLEDLNRFNVIIKSPGIPPSELLTTNYSLLTSGTQIFLDTIADTGATVIGVTGSKGKSTTSTLIYELLKADGRDVHLIGNIGKPAIEYLELAKPNTFFVQEMSSYQLMDLTVSPTIAVVTAFFPEHLDYHGSLEAYKEAKKHIARFQKKSDTIFYDATSPGAKEIADESSGKKIPFDEAESPVTLEETKMIGHHNLRNIAAAYGVARLLKIPTKTCINVFKAFQGLPHRLQSLGIHHNIEWIDDAISTTPESTIAALDALGDRVATIILGGQDRGNDFSELGRRIANSNIKTVIVFPGSGGRIREAVEGEGALKPPAPFSRDGRKGRINLSPSPVAGEGVGGEGTRALHFHPATSMQQAVCIAKEETPKNHIVLLSTASPSYGMFKNFEEKGEQFRQCIQS